MTVERVLPSLPVTTLREYEDSGGGRGLFAARELGPEALIDDLAASGLRGRGGAGFPTAVKWASVRSRLTPDLGATVVVNATEGEPGSFKDRMLVRRNPFAVLEGALIAAHAVRAPRVVFALRASCTTELDVIERAVATMRDAGWLDGLAGALEVDVFAGPEQYLCGEETGLLEAIAGRPPFPRLSPPYRFGVDEIVEHGGEPAQAEMATLDDATDATPTLVNNAETMAHVAMIAANSPAWFRELGTDESPGTFVCTVSGDTVRAGVGEFAMGTPLRDVLEELGGGVASGRNIAAVFAGAANPLVPADAIDTPTTYEAFEEIDSALGCGAFLVFDDHADFAAVAHGFSRFLAVESCGQCTPCKQDGLAISRLLEDVRDSTAGGIDLLALDDRLATVADGARCYLADQHQRVVGSIRTRFEKEVRAHIDGDAPPAPPVFIAGLVDVRDGEAILDERQAAKQPDWTFDAVDSGETPADRYGSSRPHDQPPE